MTNKGSKFLAKELAIEKVRNEKLIASGNRILKANHDMASKLHDYETLPFFKALILLIKNRRK